MSCITRNNKDQITGVVLNNGQDSKLFDDLLKIHQNGTIAYNIYQQILSPAFQSIKHEYELDSNGEPVLKNKYTTSNNIESYLVKPNITSSPTINIYSTDKNGFEKLSNLLNGPVEFNNREFKTVEHLYQWKKAMFAKDKTTAEKIFNANTGWDAQRLSKTIQNPDSKAWDEISSQQLEASMNLAFQQNPEAKKLLLSTGNTQLTHQTSKFSLGKWEKEFPRLLMKIRQELQTSTQQSNQQTTKKPEFDKDLNEKSDIWSQNKESIISKFPDLTEEQFNSMTEQEKIKFIKCYL